MDRNPAEQKRLEKLADARWLAEVRATRATLAGKKGGFRSKGVIRGKKKSSRGGGGRY